MQLVWGDGVPFFAWLDAAMRDNPNHEVFSNRRVGQTWRGTSDQSPEFSDGSRHEFNNPDRPIVNGSNQRRLFS